MAKPKEYRISPIQPKDLKRIITYFHKLGYKWADDDDLLTSKTPDNKRYAWRGQQSLFFTPASKTIQTCQNACPCAIHSKCEWSHSNDDIPMQVVKNFIKRGINIVSEEDI